MERRTFFKGLMASLAAATTGPAVARALADHLNSLRADLAAAADDAAFWRRVEAEFALEPGLVHLNNGSIGPTPVSVLEAHKAYLDRMETNPYQFAWSGFPDYTFTQVQERAASFLNADTQEVFLARNTTEAMNLVSTGMRLEPGDEILTTDHEHPGGVWCWLHMAHLHGVRIRQVHLPTPTRTKGEILELIRDGITSRTKVCSVSHINTTTGLRMPIAEIAEITRPRDILLVCDGAQAPGMLDVDVQELGVDVYASSSHKWMLAPKGTGLLYVRRDVQDRIKPVSVFSGEGSYYAPYTAGSGTRNTPQLLAHGVAMDFHDAIGRGKVERRALALSKYLRDRLATDIRLLPVTPAAPELASAMVSYQVQGMGVNALYSAMRERSIIIKRTGYNWVLTDNTIPADNVSIIRLSTHIYNSEEQLDRFVDELKDILDHSATPVLSADASKPTAFAVDPNYPNPFNSSTTIRYHLPTADHVEVAVFNAEGQLVDVLRDTWEQAGPHALSWDAPRRASGTYFCRVTTGENQDVRKMLLLR